MGDRRLEKQTNFVCVSRNLYYSELPISAKYPISTKTLFPTLKVYI